MQSQMQQIPYNRVLPTKIREAKEKSNLVVFLGAGFPRLFGCWGWDQLAKGFVEKCHQVQLLNAREKADYIQLLEDRKQTPLNMITYCYKKLAGNGLGSEISNLLHASCQADPTVNNAMGNAYAELKRLGDYYITTNYDPHFDKFFPPNLIIYKPADYFGLDWNGRQLDRNVLYHIHGSIKNVASIALTTDHYAERESNENYITFLKNAFCNYTVLFVGSGVEEYLSYVLRVIKKQGNCNRSFLLKHYFSNQQDEYSLEQSIFDDHNIELISFLGDEKEFLELIFIIKSWNNQIEEIGLEIK
jgi:hypothetical protein